MLISRFSSSSTSFWHHQITGVTSLLWTATEAWFGCLIDELSARIQSLECIKANDFVCRRFSFLGSANLWCPCARESNSRPKIWSSEKDGGVEVKIKTTEIWRRTLNQSHSEAHEAIFSASTILIYLKFCFGNMFFFSLRFNYKQSRFASIQCAIKSERLIWLGSKIYDKRSGAGERWLPMKWKIVCCPINRQAEEEARRKRKVTETNTRE